MEKTRTSRAGNLGRPSGFTLLELLVVLAVLSLIVAAIPWAVKRAAPGLQLSSASRELLNDLRTMRTVALVDGRQVELVPDRAGGGYAIHPTIAVRQLPAGMEIRIEDQLGAEIPVMRFHPDGSPSGASVELIYRGYRFKAAVGALSGRVEITQH